MVTLYSRFRELELIFVFQEWIWWGSADSQGGWRLWLRVSRTFLFCFCSCTHTSRNQNSCIFSSLMSSPSLVFLSPNKPPFLSLFQSLSQFSLWYLKTSHLSFSDIGMRILFLQLRGKKILTLYNLLQKLDFASMVLASTCGGYWWLFALHCWSSDSELKRQFCKCHYSLGSWIPGCSWSVELSLKWLNENKSGSPWGHSLMTSTKWKNLHQSIYRPNFLVLNFDILDQLRENFTFIFTLGKQLHKLFQSYFLSIYNTVWNKFWKWVKWLFHPSLCIWWSCLNFS